MYTKVDSMTITITPNGFLAHDEFPESDEIQNYAQAV